MTQIVWISSPEMSGLLGEAQQVAALVAESQRADGLPHEIGVDEMRRRYSEGGGGFPANELLDSAESIPLGPTSELRVFRVGDPRGIYLMVHSGGWLSGGPDLQDHRMAELARRAGVTVACARYRLAPEHRHPLAVDDCEVAALWLIEHAGVELGSDRIIIGGESAGAHLAALTLLRLRDRHDCVERISGANFMYGFFDLSLSPSARLAGDDGLVLPTATLEFMVGNYLGDQSIDRRDPAVSPVYAELLGLVPARFVVGDLDPLLDDTLTMSARWRAAGNSTITEIYPAGVHAFDAFPTRMAALANERQAMWMRDLLAMSPEADASTDVGTTC